MLARGTLDGLRVQATPVRIEGLTLTQKSSLAMAAQRGALVVFEPLGLQQGRLRYYDPEGRLRWEQTLPMMFREDEAWGTWLAISEDGRRVVLYEWRGESWSARAVLDETGRVLGEWIAELHMAPSGRYFYGASRFRFFDAELRPLALGLEEAFGIKAGEGRVAQYRVFRGDRLVALVKPSRSEPLTLFVYDLTQRRVLFRRALSSNFHLKLREERADLRGSTFVVSIVRWMQRGVLLWIVDLETGQVREQVIRRFHHLLLSEDGRFVVVGDLVREGGKSVNYVRLIEVRTGQEQGPYRIEGGMKYPRWCWVEGGEVRLYGWLPERVPDRELVVLRGGKVVGHMYGWFGRGLSFGYVPVGVASKAVVLQQVTLTR
ncbi:hypothetical protein SAMN04488087_1862 [Rhodothermus profundi]|uniref:Uncharacterized protein n=1 Tax=Rhodothermus profundi TaxID=633813 RepID=A0A1M6UU17_9BACT|nr:hypothetical protein SAMN04488087_1862 [Rhodothermus profundi]